MASHDILILNRLKIHELLLTKMPLLHFVSTGTLLRTARLIIHTPANGEKGHVTLARNMLVYEHYATVTIEKAMINILPKNKKCHFRCHS